MNSMAFKSYLAPMLIFGLIFSMLTTLSLRLLPKSYDVALTLNIQKIDNNRDDYYRYDGYYAIQAEDLFSTVVSTWFSSPDFVLDILRKANETPDSLGVKDLRKTFAGEKISSKTVEVRWGTKNEAQGTNTTQAMKEAIKAKLAGDQNNNYRIIMSDPVILVHKYNMLFVATAGFFLGIFLTLLVQGLRKMTRSS